MLMPESSGSMILLIYAIIMSVAVYIIHKIYVKLRVMCRKFKKKMIGIKRAYNKLKRWLSGARKKKNGQSRYIPSAVKREVWARDRGRCVLCGSRKNLCYDHDLPYSRGGTSLDANNIRILCRDCNLKKSNRIE